MRRLVILCIALSILGCDRGPVASSTAPARDEQTPAQGIAATAPATTRPAGMLIDQRRIEFPPAMLRLRDRGDSLTAILYSDDPKDAIDDNYTGNSFYFDMALDISDPRELAAARWHFKASSSERAETVSGIFLGGRKQHLQASDVTVEFSGADSPVTVFLAGTFLLFDADDESQPPRVIPVTAELSAGLIVKP